MLQSALRRRRHIELRTWTSHGQDHPAHPLRRDFGGISCSLTPNSCPSNSLLRGIFEPEPKSLGVALCDCCSTTLVAMEEIQGDVFSTKAGTKSNKYLRKSTDLRSWRYRSSLPFSSTQSGQQAKFPHLRMLLYSSKVIASSDPPYSWYWAGNPLRSGNRREELVREVRTDICEPEPCYYPDERYSYRERTYTTPDRRAGLFLRRWSISATITLSSVGGHRLGRQPISI
ncbi:uncharacterized protein BDV17DRAFT_107972 [Aspergillus undulatus]|uniref:uncharacterized protein n=1 Tax=Aspergillus undulatus TaxID=1810928 RepID=UPI003CCCF0B3